MYAPDDGKTQIGPVGGVFVMGMGLLVLGIPVAALSTIVGGREFFRGKSLRRFFTASRGTVLGVSTDDTFVPIRDDWSRSATPNSESDHTMKVTLNVLAGLAVAGAIGAGHRRRAGRLRRATHPSVP
jgi:hypothetical protein